MHLHLLFQLAVFQSILEAPCPKNTSFTLPWSMKFPAQSFCSLDGVHLRIKYRIFYDSAKVAATCAHFGIDVSASRGSYGLVPMRRLWRHVEEA